jgi:hypothetical protein
VVTEVLDWQSVLLASRKKPLLAKPGNLKRCRIIEGHVACWVECDFRNIILDKGRKKAPTSGTKYSSNLSYI